MNDDKWIVLQGEYKGLPLLVRFNQGLTTLAGNSNFSYQVGIAVPFLRPDAHGFPSAEESALLNAFEDKVAEILIDTDQTLFAAVITTGGMREFVLYTGMPESIKNRFDGLCAEIPTHKPQAVIRSDPEWKVYRGFIPRTETADE